MISYIIVLNYQLKEGRSYEISNRKRSLGQRQVPAEAYYGIETLRGKENFEITKRGICRQMIKALAIVKKQLLKPMLML